MKYLYVNALHTGKINIPKKVIAKLPKNLGLFTTIQFINHLDNIVKQLEKGNIKVKLEKGKHTKYKGQIYGCNLEKFSGEAFLYIGDGLFHPKALLLVNNKPVHIWNPITKSYSVVDNKLVDNLIKRQKAGLSKFLSSQNIGVIISIKFGQNYYKQALKLKKDYPNKRFYFIAMDTINFERLVDFPFIEIWVNAACPRIGWDDTKRIGKPILDLGSII